MAVTTFFCLQLIDVGTVADNGGVYWVADELVECFVIKWQLYASANSSRVCQNNGIYMCTH